MCDATAYEFITVFNQQPMHDDYDLRQEQLNKASLLFKEVSEKLTGEI